jgi:hypothetical protein
LSYLHIGEELQKYVKKTKPNRIGQLDKVTYENFIYRKILLFAHYTTMLHEKLKPA